MKNFQLSTITFFLFVILLAIPTKAQTTTFTYQGRLTDGAAAASGVYDLEFKLYDADGTQIGATQAIEDVSVSNGTFTTELDFGAAAFDGSTRTLEISVRRGTETGAFTTLTPRQPINSTPYAIRALHASTVETTAGNSVVDSINDSSTNVTINSDRLSADVVRLNPAETQTSTSTDSSAALLDMSGATTDTENVLGTSRFRFNFDGGFFAAGQQNFGNVPTSGAGVRMMWHAGKAAFRAGRVFVEEYGTDGSTFWDDQNVGIGSTAFGTNNRASGVNSFAAGHNANASGQRSFGFNGTASGLGAVAIGSSAQATNDDSLALGTSAIAGGLGSIVIGPSIANGTFAVAIGLQNSAAGQFSVAIGKNAGTCSNYLCGPGTERQGAIVISDACAGFSSDGLTASANNQVNIRGCGGFRFFTGQNSGNGSSNGSLVSGVELAPGGSQWLSLSDRNSKENFQAVNSRDILRKVLNLPITTWNYKSQDASIRHIGAMAQDFKAAFAVGEDDRHISSLDPDGVALAAIQGLNEEMNERTMKLQAENEALRRQVETQKKQFAALEERLKKLEQPTQSRRKTKRRK